MGCGITYRVTVTGTFTTEIELEAQPEGGQPQADAAAAGQLERLKLGGPRRASPGPGRHIPFNHRAGLVTVIITVAWTRNRHNYSDLDS